MKKNTPVAKDNNDFLNNPEKPKKIDNKQWIKYKEKFMHHLGL